MPRLLFQARSEERTANGPGLHCSRARSYARARQLLFPLPITDFYDTFLKRAQNVI